MYNRKKKILYTLLFICFFACAAIVVAKMPIQTAQDQDSDKNSLELHPIVEKMLSYMEIDNCLISALPQYDNLSIKLFAPTVLPDEVEQYIDNILQDWKQPYLTDAFVQEAYNVDSISEFKEKIASILTEQKKIALIANARSEVVNQLLSHSKFSINEHSIAKYALQAVEFYETDAYTSNLSFDEYISQKYGDQQTFYESCYQNACSEIKEYLLIGAIAYKEGLLTDTSWIDSAEEGEVYMMYQDLENTFYRLFISADENF